MNFGCKIQIFCCLAFIHSRTLWLIPHRACFFSCIFSFLNSQTMGCYVDLWTPRNISLPPSRSRMTSTMNASPYNYHMSLHICEPFTLLSSASCTTHVSLMWQTHFLVVLSFHNLWLLQNYIIICMSPSASACFQIPCLINLDHHPSPNFNMNIWAMHLSLCT